MKKLHHETRVKRLHDFLEDDQKRKKKKKKKSKKGKDGQDEIDVDDSIAPQFHYEHEMEVTVEQLGPDQKNFMPQWGCASESDLNKQQVGPQLVLWWLEQGHAMRPMKDKNRTGVKRQFKRLGSIPSKLQAKAENSMAMAARGTRMLTRLPAARAPVGGGSSRVGYLPPQSGYGGRS